MFFKNILIKKHINKKFQPEPRLSLAAWLSARRDWHASRPSPTNPRVFAGLEIPDAGELEGARRLSYLAFDELSRRDLTSSTSGSPPADLPPLLRLCLCLLSLPCSADSDLAFRRCTSLLASLRGILSRGPGPSLLAALDVFLENLVSSNQLMSCFTAANAAMPKRSRVTAVVSACCGGNLFVMELMSHHFISSVQDEEGFLSALSWSAKAKLEIPEIGLLGALSLLRKSCLLSIPPAIQAHFLLLACRCVGDGDLDMHLLAFEHAMNVYLSYLPALGVFRRTSGVKNPLGCFMKRRPLNSCIQAAAHQKLTCDISRLVLFCKLRSGDDLPINENDIACFIEENQQVLHEQSRQDIVAAVKIIVSNVLVLARQEEMDRLDPNVSEEIICLAATLRLMGSSFIRIMHGIRQIIVANASQTTHCLEPCKVLNFISETICLLGHYEAIELERNDLFDTISKPGDREQGAMLMLSHFATLSVHCLRMRFGFMWKGCIFMMMMANLCATEMHSVFIDGSKGSDVCCAGQDGTLKGSVLRKSSTAIALRFKNIQKVYIQDTVHDFGEGCSSDTLRRCTSNDGREDIQTILKYLPGCGDNSTDDLLDFIECKPGLDCSNFWTQHQKFKRYKKDKWIRSKRHSMRRLRTSKRWLK